MKLAIALVLLSACSNAPRPPPAVASARAPAPPVVAAPATSESDGPALEAYESKQWARCAELYRRIDDADARYNGACCYALDGKHDQAFAMLERVIADEFRDVAHLKADPDLASLHADPRWPQLVAAIEANAARFEASIEASIEEPGLRRELLALGQEDQAARQQLINNMQDHAAQARTSAIDARATARMKEIIAKHGWPGKTLVGEDGSSTAWLLVQHADNDRAFQKQCLALLEKAYRAGEAHERHYAYLYDRVAVGEGRPQRYGTQFRDGKPEPIEDEARVDERRKAIGLGTMAEYAKDMEQMYGKQEPASAATP